MKLDIKNIVLNKVDSTNTVIRKFTVKEGQLLTVAAAYQTGGYGQKGNTWESEEGKNLLFSMIFYAGFVPADRQFLISQAVSLSIRKALADYIPDEEMITIKWPNDIYYKDKKICGFLVSCDIEDGCLTLCTIGIGLNINQETFTSDAPNPISLKQIIHSEKNITEIKLKILHYFERYYDILHHNTFSSIEKAYAYHLYHRQGMHQYKDKQGLFMAEIRQINSQGILTLRDDAGKERHYAFKEVIQLPD